MLLISFTYGFEISINKAWVQGSRVQGSRFPSSPAGLRRASRVRVTGLQGISSKFKAESSKFVDDVEFKRAWCGRAGGGRLKRVAQGERRTAVKKEGGKVGG
jgi:hypothetical protein